MKQCPACRNTYTDETLKFCLSDGNLLSDIDREEPPTLIFQERNPMQVNIPPNTEPTMQFSVPTVQNQKKSIFPLVLIAIFALLLLAVIGVGAIFLFKPFGGNETAVVSNNSNNSNNSNTKTNISTDTQSKELEEKLANLERQLQEQKNQKKNTTTQPFSTPPTVTANTSGNPTARVRPSSDGFLSLRTEPNVKTGTQLIKIPTGSTVKLENCEKNFLTIDGRRGRWCMVSYNGETGWAFDAWLQY